MTFLTVEYYEQIKDFLHPHINSFVKDYRNGNIIGLMPFHGCNQLNRNGTRKYIDYGRGYQCILPTHKCYWRKTKDIYKERRVYWTRYMTQYSIRHLFKNKDNLVKLNKYIHLSKTPMKGYLQYIEVVKNQPIKDYKNE